MSVLGIHAQHLPGRLARTLFTVESDVRATPETPGKGVWGPRTVRGYGEIEIRPLQASGTQLLFF